MSQFVDRVRVFAQAGNGGHGCMSILREKYRPLGGPDGGNGGHGGSVIVRVDSQIGTLLDFHYRPHQTAENGKPGQGDNKQGEKGSDLILRVPQGTIIKDEDEQILADLSGESCEYVLARGGVGGKGNAALQSKRRKAPGFALLGEPGEKVTRIFELKSMADVALVGFPSSGKSSLISAISAATPQIADYPFTTLRPHLGVVEVENFRYTVADVPGLIPGAAQGKGLGLDFLRHIERCAVIVHVVDMAVLDEQRNPVDDIKAIEKELMAYSSQMDGVRGVHPLDQRPRLIALNKMDVPDSKDMADIVHGELADFGWPIARVSAVSREGLREFLLSLARIIELYRVTNPIPEGSQRPVLRPEPDYMRPSIVVSKKKDDEGDYYVVDAEHVKRWVVQTDFSNDEAIGFLAERLKNGGVEDRLQDAGAREGDRVVIGDILFDFEPALSSGAELLGARGSDERVHAWELAKDGRRARRTNVQRRHDYHQRMNAKERARQELQEERREGIWTDPSH